MFLLDKSILIVICEYLQSNNIICFVCLIYILSCLFLVTKNVLHINVNFCMYVQGFLVVMMSSAETKNFSSYLEIKEPVVFSCRIFKTRLKKNETKIIFQEIKNFLVLILDSFILKQKLCVSFTEMYKKILKYS